MTGPTPEGVLAAAAALAPLVRRTPVLRAEVLDDLAGCAVYAKAEGLQLTGSFKVRGALNKVRSLDEGRRDAGLVTISAGNAALGAAYAARRLGARLTVVMPEHAVAEKLAAVRALGAEVVNDGVTSAAVAFERAAELQAARGLTLVHPFDDPEVICGAATATLELLQDHPELERVLIPCSGGGLLAGAVLAREALGSQVELVGVQPAGAATWVRSLVEGRPCAVDSPHTVADGLTAPRPGALNLALVAARGIEVRTVDDDEILAATGSLVRALRVVVEPSAAAPLAALLAGPPDPRPTGLLLSGSNVSWSLLARVLV